ncbi:alpha/beta fold hydrolase [Rhodopila sp.]|uniref:alpha/beta fold hydrolase n=1 Tax=Rhodopila sp. TaxID=2480087 RepID=UPI003D107E56
MRAGRIRVDGGELETGWWGPGPTQAATLVLLHEGLGSVALWRDVPELLSAATGWGVFAYSRFGYGDSAAARLPRPMTYMHHEAEVVLPQVLRVAGIRRSVLVGHSDGGSIAAIYAALGDAGLGHAGLGHGASGDVGPALLGPALLGLVTIAAHFFVEDVNVASIRGIRTEYESGALRQRLARYHRDVEVAFRGWNDAWLDPRFRDFDITERLGGIRVPILALQGEADPYGSAEQLQVFAAHARAPIETGLIAGARHSPHLEAKEATLAAIAGFIATLERGAST